MPSLPRLKNGTLSAFSPWLKDIPKGWSIVADPSKTGVFLKTPPPSETASYHTWNLGTFSAAKHYVGQHRFVPFWLRPILGNPSSVVPPETLWLLVEHLDGMFGLLVALIHGDTRFSLGGDADSLKIVAETGDPQVPTNQGPALYFAAGKEPFALLDRAARAVQGHFSLPHRVERAVPDFVDQFGWCTWDAFYKEVSPEKIAAGLDSFARGGVSPKLLIIDDGWQSVERSPSGEERLTSLEPNARFAGSLRPTVDLAKGHYGVRTVLAWHALMGYWGGLNQKNLSVYKPRTIARSFGPGILMQE